MPAMYRKRGGAHFQDIEIEILTTLLRQIQEPIVVDAGAERGEFTAAFVNANARRVFAVEPHPENARYLRERFVDSDKVAVLELALGDRDVTGTLHLARDKTGQAEHSYHSLVPCGPTDTIEWTGTVEVPCRRLDTLASDGLISASIDVLKIDTERADFDVIRGLGDLAPSVIMFEFWDGLQKTVGDSPYTPHQVLQHLRDRGYRDYAMIQRRDMFQSIQINDDRTMPGEWGNVVVLHSEVSSRFLPTLFEAAGRLQRELVASATMLLNEATARLKVIDEISQRVETLQFAADQRLRLLQEQESSVRQSTDIALRLTDQVASLQERITRQDELLDAARGELEQIKAESAQRDSAVAQTEHASVPKTGNVEPLTSSFSLSIEEAKQSKPS